MKTCRSYYLINQFDPEKNASNFKSNINIFGGKIHQGFKAKPSKNVFSGTIEQKSIVYQDTNHVSQSEISFNKVSSDVECHRLSVWKGFGNVKTKQEKPNYQNKSSNSKNKMTNYVSVFQGIKCKNRYSILQNDTLSCEYLTMWNARGGTNIRQ